MGGVPFLMGKYPRPIFLIRKCQTVGCIKLRNKNNTYNLHEVQHLQCASYQRSLLLCVIKMGTNFCAQDLEDICEGCHDGKSFMEEWGHELDLERQNVAYSKITSS